MAHSHQVQLSRSENIGEPVCPVFLAWLVTDLVVANFNHGRREAPRAGVSLNRVIDLVGRRIGFVDANSKRGVGLEPANEGIGHAAAVLVEDDSHLPWSRLAKIYWGEGVDRDQHCRQSRR